MPKSTAKKPEPLPAEVLYSLRYVLDNYDRLKASPAPRAGDDAEAAKLRATLDSDPDDLWWSDLAEAELCVIDLLDADDLRARLSGWRRRLHEVAGDERYAAYLTNACDLKDPAVTPVRLRADLSECIRAVYYFYGAHGLGAQVRSVTAKKLFHVAAWIIGIELVVWLLLALRPGGHPLVPLPNDGYRTVIFYVIATSIMSVMGSVVSVERRLQDPNVQADPFYRYVQVTGDSFSVASVSPLLATTFGPLVYALLASGYISTKLINFTTTSPAGLPVNVSDAAGLLIIAFVSGFAESLIPDALTRIAASTLSSVKTSPEKPAPAAQGGDGAPQTGQTNGKATITNGKASGSDGKVTNVQSDEQVLKPQQPLQRTTEAMILGQDPNLASQPKVR